MSQGVSLDDAVLNLSILREHARQRLIEALDSVDGKKALVLDPRLSGPLALVAQTSLLKEHGVESLFHFTPEPLHSECASVVFLLRPRPQLIPIIAAQLRADQLRKATRKYYAFFVPRCTYPCRKAMEAAGLSQVAVGEYPLQFFPFEDDALSLELDSSFKEFHLDLVRTSMLDAARALASLQTAFGVAPLVKGKGDAALLVARAMEQNMREQRASIPPLPQSGISMMVLIDRKVDMVTPMCTQLTYEGLLDEILHIHNGAVEVDPSVLSNQQPLSQPQPQGQAQALGAAPEPPAAPPKRVKLPLNSSDRLFRELRNVNFGVAAEVLRSKAVKMKADYATIKHQNAHQSAGAAGSSSASAEQQQGQSVTDLKDFVKKLNALPELTRHTSLAQHIAQFTNKPSFGAHLTVEQNILEARSIDSVYEYVEDMIGRQEPLPRVLRMLILLSVTSGGLPKPKFDFLRREILQTYGIRYMLPLASLEGAGIIKKQEGARYNWNGLKRTLRLIVDDDDDAKPRDVGFMFSGYAPISIRLVEHAIDGGWRPLEESLKLLPGPAFEWKQSQNGCEHTDHPEPLRRKGTAESQRRRTVLVVFLGGVTFAEIAALRFLSTKDGSTDFVVVTTKFISGTSLVNTLLEL